MRRDTLGDAAPVRGIRELPLTVPEMGIRVHILAMLAHSALYRVGIAAAPSPLLDFAFSTDSTRSADQ